MDRSVNYHAYYADYAAVASCLDTIREYELRGQFSSGDQLLTMLRSLETDYLKKLYIRSRYTLAELTKTAPEGSTVPENYFYGDFDEEDFIFDDFYAGYVDFDSTSYAILFRTVLRIFAEIKTKGYILSEAQLEALDADLIAFMRIFWEIQQKLKALLPDVCTPITSNRYDNSRGILVQAAGSDGSNGIVKGIHLRWMLTHELGQNHLPKGNLYPVGHTGANIFNRANDFVRVFRTGYSNEHALFFDLNLQKPVVLFAEAQAIFTINLNLADRLFTNHVVLTFEDRAALEAAAVAWDIHSGFGKLLNAYKGVIRIDLIGKCFFNLAIQVQNIAESTQHLKLEAISQIDIDHDNIDDQLNSYFTRSIAAGEVNVLDFMADNMTAVRLKKEPGLQLINLQLETYESLLLAKEPADWTELEDGFALSLDDTTVFDRLENSSKPIDNRWPQYNEGTRLRAANYRDKWLHDYNGTPGLKLFLANYLQRSDTDPRALEVIEQTDPGTGEINRLNLSYIDMLNFIAFDYHFARMLGLAYIDNAPLLDSNNRFIYQVRYSNKNTAGDLTESELWYTTIPIAMTDTRIAERPKMRPVNYHFPHGENNKEDQFDELGYNKFERTRIVNLGREQSITERMADHFFTDLSRIVGYNEFLGYKNIHYGIEYRKSTDQFYIKPEITHSEGLGDRLYYNYDDSNPNGVLETVPVLDNKDSLYIHLVKENGKHVYAIYGVNLFDRATAVSEEESTDETFFPPINRLQAPLNVTAHYLQTEDELLFTTQTEQHWLQARKQQFPDKDIGLTRLVFDWLDIVDISDHVSLTAAELMAVPKADTIKGLFLDRMPMTVSGRITAVEELPHNPDFARLITGSYVLLDGTQLDPFIPEQDYFRFVNSILTTGEGNFRVQGIEQGALGIEIIIDKTVVSSLVPGTEADSMAGIDRKLFAPKKDGKFMLVENLGNIEAWHAIAATVRLQSFAQAGNPVIRSTISPTGVLSTYWIGGITAQAQVTPLFGAAYTDSAPLPGCYRVDFPDYELAEHPQANPPYLATDPQRNAPDQFNAPHVEWYKGLIRMPLVDKEVSGDKDIQVLRIASLNPLQLYVMDPDYLTAPLLTSSDSGELIEVNFHPGYKAYIFSEPKPSLFHRDHIEPPTENDKKTLITLYSEQTAAEQYRSAVATPTTIFAMRQEHSDDLAAPVALGGSPVPSPLLRRARRALAAPEPLKVKKLRPDSRGRASFTFDSTIFSTAQGVLNTSPYGYAFYRLDVADLLEALYEPRTIATIWAALTALQDDHYYYQRFQDLANQVFVGPDAGEYPAYEAAAEVYGFPLPDRAGLTAPSDTLGVRKEKYQEAIRQVLLPLTERTVVFEEIRIGMETENSVPTIKDSDERLLSPADPRYDPFPMVRRYQANAGGSEWTLRFTDYNLDSNYRSLYFYAINWVNIRLIPGTLSKFMGPAEVLQTVASEAPKLAKYELLINTNIETIGPRVRLLFEKFSVLDNISKIIVHRFSSLENAVRLTGSEWTQTYQLVDDDAQIAVLDDFATFARPPFGATFYYRCAGVRVIRNEYGEQEEVLTRYTEIITVGLPERRNRSGISLRYDEEAAELRWTSNGDQYTYYLYRLNRVGNWERVGEYSKVTTDGPVVYPMDASRYPKYDSDGDALYYRFKLREANSLGELSLQDSEITV